MRWVQLTLVENDPGRFDPSSGSTTSAACTPTPPRSAPAASSPTTRPRFRSTIAAPGSATTRSVRHARRRLPRARHARRRADRSARGARRRAGGASGLDRRRRRTGSRGRHWANPDLWVTCALGPYNFEFMDQVHREIVTRYKVDGIFANRWAPQGGDCYCVHCQRELQGGDRPASCRASPTPRTRRAAQFLEWRKARLTELWKQWDATIRAANPEARFIPNGPPDLKTAGELAAIQFTDNQARRGMTPPWANGRRAKEYPLGHGPAADRRHLQRRARGAVSLEGLGAERAGDPALGRRGHGQRHAAVGDEVLRRALRPPLAADGRAHLPLALRARALPAQRDAARARRAAALGTDRDVPSGRGRGRSRRRSRARHVSRARRGARAVRDGARGVPHARSPRSRSSC